ncbi:hypothetical protein C0991_007464 [Blastosporella zonata]|nr:hypothetical protein C0991_007464 [Blastosporella zonata]
MDTILNQITTSNNAVALNHTLRKTLPKDPTARDLTLASPLSSGQDPLSVLDMRENTLGALWILAARFSVQASAAPSWSLVQEFCRTFIPEHARLASDRVSALARGIVSYANASPNPKAAIQPLYDLVRRYPPDYSYLTSMHTVFALHCVQTQSYVSLLPVLATPITNIDLPLSPDLNYNDSLIYHYLGGIAYAALKRWSHAEEFFEIALSTPGTAASAVQLEALKKLKLVQLIASGKEKNTGLIHQALARAPRWTLKKLTSTYVTLSLSDIAKAIKLPSETAVRALLLDMIESADISAQISASGTVTFSDLPPSLPSSSSTATSYPTTNITPSTINALLSSTQSQADFLRSLELEMSASKEYLAKAVKNRESDSVWAQQGDEELFSLSAAGVWADDAAFV